MPMGSRSAATALSEGREKRVSRAVSATDKRMPDHPAWSRSLFDQIDPDDHPARVHVAPLVARSCIGCDELRPADDARDRNVGLVRCGLGPRWVFMGGHARCDKGRCE